MPTRLSQTSTELDQARDHFRNHVIPSEKLKVMDRATKELIDRGIRSTALKEGDHVEDFILMDAHGAPVRLRELLRQGPVVIAFYRGGWCPYCNIELRGLQRVLGEIKELGGSLVAISPQLPDNSLSTEEKSALEFPVLSDVGNVIAKRFGVAFRLPVDLLEIYKDFNHELLVVNGEQGSHELPIPATFVLNKDGVIHLAFVEEDYTKRLEPELILESLRQLAT